MKIGILTQPLHSNYGGLLQNYALQQVLIHANHEVETIDWWKPNNLRTKLSMVRWSMLSFFFPSKYQKQRYQPNQKELDVICRNTNHFISAYIKHTRAARSNKDFIKLSQKGDYEAYVVGSDQCWRPCYNAFLFSMFLDFVRCKQVKRIAYAASFGTDKWEFTPRQTDVCATLAQKFDLVTVREDSGMALCKEYLKVDAIHVLDPTMLLTKEDYIHLIEKEKEPKAVGTLFNYILDPDEKKKTFIQRVADSRGLTSFQVLPKCQAENRTKEDVKKHIEDCVFPSVVTWLRAFMDAEMTIVDSFHGMVFSILFNKPFWVIGNTCRGMSRFISLLKVFNLESRLLNADKFDSVDFNAPIDWEKVNRILEMKRSECKELLLNKVRE